MGKSNRSYRPSPTFEERLADGRAVIAAIRSGAIDPVLPGHFVDQLAAAADDAHSLSHRFSDAAAALEPDRCWEERCGAVPALDARILVALAACRPCVHLRRSGPQPAWARLACRRLDCGRCIHTIIRPPAGEDDRCDWCGRRGVDLFAPVALQRGPMIVIGEACDSCSSVLQEAA